MKENEYETIYNNDKEEFLLEKEEEKNELFINSKIIDNTLINKKNSLKILIQMKKKMK